MKRALVLCIIFIIINKLCFAYYDLSRVDELNTDKHKATFDDGKVVFEYYSSASNVCTITIEDGKRIAYAFSVPNKKENFRLKVFQLKNTDDKKIFYLISDELNKNQNGFGYILGINDKTNKWETLVSKNDFYAPFNNQILTVRNGDIVIYSYCGTDQNHVYNLTWNNDTQSFDYRDVGYSEQGYFNDKYGTNRRYLHGYAHMDTEYYIDIQSLHTIYEDNTKWTFMVNVLAVDRNSDVCQWQGKKIYNIDKINHKAFRYDYNTNNFESLPSLSRAYGYQMSDCINVDRCYFWRFGYHL